MYNKRLINIVLAIIVILNFQTVAAQLPNENITLIEVRQIWDNAEHNAFTDLIYYKDYWYCAFREAISHVSREGKDDGKLRVIRSVDGKGWESVALMSWDNGDVRDAKLSITAKNELLLNGAVFFYPLSRGEPQLSITWLSNNGVDWSDAYTCTTGSGTWRWSVTWHNNIGYSVGYSGKDVEGCLYRTSDGKVWEVVKENFFPDNESRPNEANIVFSDDGTAYCLLRRDGGACTALLGIAQYPYTNWEWKDLGVRIGGPKFIQLKDGRFLATLRLFPGEPDKVKWEEQRTSVCFLDVENANLTEVFELPSGGDSSYAGMIEHEGVIWISYYSSHEGRTSIYLAKIRI
jgi:hypothetical protein